MVKKAYEVTYQVPGVSSYDLVIVLIEEGKEKDKEYMELVLRQAIAEKNKIRKKSLIDISSYRLKDFNLIHMKDLSVSEFALLFDLRGKICNDK